MTLATARIPLYAFLGLTLLVVSAVLALDSGAWGLFVLGAVGPDVALLGLRGDGRLRPRWVPVYNALHRFPGPLVVLALGAPVLAAAWAAHVAIDRAVGYGLRAPDGTIRGV